MRTRGSGRFVPFLLVLAPLFGGEPAAPLEPGVRSIEQDRLLLHVEVLAAAEFEGRGAGTEGAELAAAYLAQRLRALQLEPAGTHAFRQPFRGRGRALANVVALLPGSDLADEVVVLGAHFDHLGRVGDRVFHGADDNASGCAALLEVARALRLGAPPRRSVLFVAFDGEEIGLLGSRHFVAHPTVARERIVAMLNLDMVGRGETGDVRVCGTPHSASLQQAVEAAAPAVGLTLHYDHERAWRNASDHAPFGDARIPFLYVGVLEHEDYHRPTDTVDKIDGEKLLRIARLVYLTVRAVADADEPPAWRDP